MKIAVFSFLIVAFSFLGCQSNSHEKVRLMGEQSKAYPYNQLKENEKNRQNEVAISNIDAKTKIEIAKIEAKNKALVAELQAKTSKEVAKTDATTKITTAQINSSVKKDSIKSTTYIAIAIILLLIIALILLYFNSKKNRELQAKLNKEQIDKDILIHEKELTEQRFHKILDLVGEGKLSPDVEQEVLKSLTNPANSEVKIIEHK